MTPKEKAKKLVNKYLNAPFNCKDCDMPYCDVGCTQLMESEAQECALIAVDEILNTNTLEIRYCGYVKLCEKHLEFWQEVKKEIQE